MVSLSHAEQEPRRMGATRGIHLGAWLRQTLRAAAAARRQVCSVVERVLRVGTGPAQPVDTRKRIRLCNINALGGAIIMATWAYLEASFGDVASLPWELAFLAGFLSVLALNASGAHRAGRLLLIINANLCVFAGALLFTEPSGGTLPFFSMAAIALLMFGPREWWLATLGAALPAVLLAAVKSGVAASVLSIEPQPAPGWYFAANAATSFALAFLVPFFF